MLDLSAVPDLRAALAHGEACCACGAASTVGRVACGARLLLARALIPESPPHSRARAGSPGSDGLGRFNASPLNSSGSDSWGVCSEDADAEGFPVAHAGGAPHAGAHGAPYARPALPLLHPAAARPAGAGAAPGAGCDSEEDADSTGSWGVREEVPMAVHATEVGQWLGGAGGNARHAQRLPCAMGSQRRDILL